MFQGRASQKCKHQQSLYITLTFLSNTRIITAELGGGVKCTQLHGVNLRPGCISVSRVPCHPLSPIVLLVREQAGKRLSQVSDGLRLGFVLVAGTEGLAKGVEGIGQGLGFAAKQRTKQKQD